MQIGVPGPTGGAELSRRGDGPEMPPELPSHRIIGRNESAHARITARRADNYFAVHHEGRAGCAVMLSLVGIRNLPPQAAGASVEAKQVGIVSFHVDKVLPHRNTAVLVHSGVI